MISYPDPVRTTLTLDDRVLAAARSRARARGITLGQAVSELALKGFEAETGALTVPAGFPVLAAVEGHVITPELVADALDDA